MTTNFAVQFVFWSGTITGARSVCLSIFIAREHAYVCRALYCCGKSVCPSVCLSHSSIAWKRMHTPSNSFRRLAGAWLHFRALARYIIPRGSLSAGALNTRDWENLRFSTDVAVYLGTV